MYYHKSGNPYKQRLKILMQEKTNVKRFVLKPAKNKLQFISQFKTGLMKKIFKEEFYFIFYAGGHR
jgi:hypothetical protein